MVRTQRKDGRQTTEKLLLCAVRLTAAKGFAAVTSKEICEMAGMNLAAVNYHFGSREGLYEEMIYYVHDRMLDEDTLKRICEADVPPRERLEMFLDSVVKLEKSHDGEDIRCLILQVWLKECFNNPALMVPVMQRIASAKVPWVLKLFAAYTGRQVNDEVLYSGLISFVAPFILLNMGACMAENAPQSAVGEYLTPDFVRRLKDFAFAGLDSLCV